jgi:hypothetical protein
MAIYNIMDDIKTTVETYSALGEPIPYKDWLIHPIKMKNYYDFLMIETILDINKNDSGDINIIQMSYLQYLIDVLMTQEPETLIKLSSLLTLTMDLKEGEDCPLRIDEKGRYSLEVQGHTMTTRDFDDLRHIVLYQNVLNYKDMSQVDTHMRKDIEEYYRLKNRGIKAPSIEKKIAVIQSETGMEKSKLMDMTIREFDILFDTIISKIDYKVMKNAELSGFVKFDKPVDHWVYAKEKGDFSDAFVSYNQLEKTINSANG